MTIAQRVRDQRYAKGWGPDELAHRAAISRTALYQIECGKTEVPRAATLNRIAQALEIPIESLIGREAPRGATGWSMAAGPVEDVVAAFEGPGLTAASRALLHQKLDELLNSSLGEGVARIVSESHRLLTGHVGATRARA